MERIRRRLPAGADKVRDVDRVPLAVAIDPPDPLLQPVRVERDVVVDHPVAVPLRVNTLTGAVGGEQDAYGIAIRGRLERFLQMVALDGVEAAVQQPELAARRDRPR